MTELELLTDGARDLGVDITEGQKSQLRRLLDVLGRWNQRVNLTSAAALADAERVHLLDSLTLVPLIKRDKPSARDLVDVGTGAGFPGFVLKIVMPELHVVLVEATRKKAQFLRWCRDELDLTDVEVVAERAEAAARRDDYRERFDVATARALGPLSVVMELTLPFCRIGGVLLASRGGDANEQADIASRVATQLGGDVRGAEPVTFPGLAERKAIVVVDKVRPTPEQFPRRSGMPAKNPLTGEAD
jgi:16S rRNA (guanine527-N7)-methyltransferase